MTGLSLRSRLTLVVALVFGVALILAGVGARELATSALRDGAHQAATALLVDYIETLEGGAIGVAEPEEGVTTRFLYLDAAGREISDAEYEQLLFDAVLRSFEDLTPTVVPPDLEELAGVPVVLDFEGAAELVEVIGPIEDTDRGDDVLAVGMPVTIGETPLTVVVSSPLRPIRDSVGTLTFFGIVAVPLLTLVIAVATWFIVGRSLAPVEAIAGHADRITAASLDERVPEPPSGDEIAHLARTVNRMLERLEVASLTQRQFIADASHELRSPVTATLATLQTMPQSPSAEEWATTAPILIEEQHRLARLIDDLLLLARLDEVTSPALDEKVDLDELALAQAERPHDVPVSVQVRHPARVRGSTPLLDRCVANLVDNAARHARSAVWVTVDQVDGMGRICVEDDGPGIPEADRQVIFERFSRLEAARTREGGGAGLGLAITRRITVQHHGDVLCDESPHGGARFVLTIPIGPR